MNRNKEITRRRDADVYGLYKRLVESGAFRSDAQVVRTIAAMPAPCSYIDPRTLERCIRILRDGKALPVSPGAGRYYYLYGRWACMEGRESLGMTAACERLVNLPAPSFYLSADRIRKTIQRCRREEREARHETVR